MWAATWGGARAAVVCRRGSRPRPRGAVPQTDRPALSQSRVLDTHPGHPGLAKLAAIQPATGESGLERRLGKIIPPGATPQFWLTGLSGRRYRADFAYVEERVFIEADGRDAHARMLAFDDDRARDNDIV